VGLDQPSDGADCADSLRGAAFLVLCRLPAALRPSTEFLDTKASSFLFENKLGGPHWSSFPSGTATISAAIVATIWLIAPRLRLTCALLAGLVCAAVIVTNQHWVSDVIAGAFLGASIGWMTVALLGSPVLPPLTDS
jgi:membrane-associated phospholipid phosphatase